MENIIPVVSETFTPGAILVSSWGWEQTNIDFYVIVERKNAFVKLLKISNRSEYIGNMTSKELPGNIYINEKPFRKKIKSWDGIEKGFSILNGWCSLWDGKEKTATHYA